MFIKKTILLSSLLIASISSYANENDSQMYDDIDAGSVSKVSDVKSGSESASSKYGSLGKSFYLDMKSKIGLPNIKLEYTNNTYTTRYGDTTNTYINNESNLVDVNLQYGDAVSYYTIYSPIKSFGLNLGGGLRQYLGKIEYKDNNFTEKESLNSTIPLTYIDLFYELSQNSSYIGFYSKESQLKNDKIQESGIYYKKRISGVDNLNLTASYAFSDISFSKAYNANDYSGVETDGINLQLRFSY